LSEQTSKTIVICDDNDPLVQLMRHMLVKEGYRVVTAADGQEGLRAVRSAPADLLLLDLQMPSLDGLAVLEGLKSFERRPYTIVVSGLEDPAKRDQAVALGAQEVWKKPFVVADLLARIKAMIAEGVL